MVTVTAEAEEGEGERAAALRLGRPVDDFPRATGAGLDWVDDRPGPIDPEPDRLDFELVREPVREAEAATVDMDVYSLMVCSARLA